MAISRVITFLLKARLAIKAWQELGPAALFWFASYHLGLRTGFTRRRTRAALAKVHSQASGPLALDLLRMPDRLAWSSLLDAAARERLLQQAGDICQGRLRMFDGDLTPIVIVPTAPHPDWTAVSDSHTGRDSKFIWEPGRFGWVYPLAQADILTQDECWPEAFWSISQAFFAANPPYTGPQWSSGQEVALRLVSLVFAAQVFHTAQVSTPERMARLAWLVAAHAARLPPTLAYARAQNNNHLLSEAAGLFTAGLALPQHPQAAGWRDLGWRTLQDGMAAQIAPDGAYIQHSANYHRLMLQLAQWVTAIGTARGFAWPVQTQTRLAAAARWLAALLDPVSGQTPNLGPNDGAYILPLTQCAFPDYRPALQAAWRMFLQRPLLPSGPWDDLGLWLGLPSTPAASHQDVQKPAPGPLILRHPHINTWCYLRCARFTARPGHADQLHLDVWWRGLNLALDPGTYRYTDAPPWDNALAHSAVHNTLTLDGRQQMTPAGRFLYLDWAQAEITLTPHASPTKLALGEGDRTDFTELSAAPPPALGEGKRTKFAGVREIISARHNGYRRLGAVHERSVAVTPQGWIVTDRLLPIQVRRSYRVRRSYLVRLNWLLPDWPWEIQAELHDLTLSLTSPFGPVRLEITLTSPPMEKGERTKFAGVRKLPSLRGGGPANEVRRGEGILKICLARAGQSLYGDIPAHPTWGWVSPQYGRKEPALSLSMETSSPLPLTFITQWILPSLEDAP